MYAKFTLSNHKPIPYINYLQTLLICVLTIEWHSIHSLPYCDSKKRFSNPQAVVPFLNYFYFQTKLAYDTVPHFIILSSARHLPEDKDVRKGTGFLKVFCKQN